jgi:hypothetical protein
MRRGRQELVGDKSERYDQTHPQGQPQYGGPCRPVPSHRFRRSEQLIQADRRQCTRRAAGGVILIDQRPWISPHHHGDGADVPAGVKVATTGRIVAALDTFDDRFLDPGPPADLGNAQTGPLAGLCQHSPDAHPAPPLLYRATPSPTCWARSVGTTLPVYPPITLGGARTAIAPASAHPQLRAATGPAASRLAHAKRYCREEVHSTLGPRNPSEQNIEQLAVNLDRPCRTWAVTGHDRWMCGGRSRVDQSLTIAARLARADGGSTSKP